MEWVHKNTERLKKVLYFLGRRTTAWLVVGIAAGATMGFAELGLSVLLQSLLVSLGIIQTDMTFLADRLVLKLSSPALLLTALFVVIAVKGISLFLVSQSSAVANELINARLRFLAIYDLLNSKNFVSAADVNARVGDTFPKAALFAQQAATAIPILIQGAVLLFFMYMASWRESTIALGMIIVIGLAILFTNQKVRRIASQVPKEQKALIKGIERIARNWLLVKILRTEKLEGDQLAQNIANYSSHFVRSRLLANLVASLPIVLGGVMLAVILWLNLNYFDTPGPILLAFLYLLVRFTQLLATLARSIGGCASYYPHFRIAAQYFFSFPNHILNAALHPSLSLSLNNKPSLLEPSVQNKSYNPTDANLGRARLNAPKIEVKNLSFRYRSGLSDVLQNLNITIPAGEQYGIVGRSGSGKSTLLALILGVLEPTKGSILIDGLQPNDYFRQKDVRIGYVGAEAFLIEGSIKENLSYGARPARPLTDGDYWEALKLAKLDKTIAEKPQQLNFRLKENGEGLSAGQKQRLALARAFLTSPQILILDEASANLDEQTELEITESIQQSHGHWTVLIVSHRRGILSNSLQVFDFENIAGSQPRSPDVTSAGTRSI
jgi:ABC-type multidrug transport system fused ATPase/permease subunit